MNVLHDYQTFNSMEEMNQEIKQHLKMKTVAENDRALFQLISQYAVKFPGATHLRVAMLAQELGCSDKTVRRMLNRLVEHKMIEKIMTIRKERGGTGANILVILPFDSTVTIRSSLVIVEDL